MLDKFRLTKRVNFERGPFDPIRRRIIRFPPPTRRTVLLLACRDNYRARVRIVVAFKMNTRPRNYAQSLFRTRACLFR